MSESGGAIALNESVWMVIDVLYIICNCVQIMEYDHYLFRSLVRLYSMVGIVDVRRKIWSWPLNLDTIDLIHKLQQNCLLIRGRIS